MRACLLLMLLLFTAASADMYTFPEFERVELDNGVVLLLHEKHDVPLVGLRAVIRGGAVADPAGLNGLSSLLAALMEKGSGERSSAEFAEAVDSAGGRLSAYAALEAINVSAEFMASDVDLMVELLADMLQRPEFSEDEFEKLRDRRINSIRAAKDGRPGALMPVYGSAFLFGAHPYGNPVNGSETTLADIRLDDLTAYG